MIKLTTPAVIFNVPNIVMLQKIKLLETGRLYFSFWKDLECFNLNEQ